MIFSIKIPNTKCIKELKEMTNMYGEFLEHIKIKIQNEDDQRIIFSQLKRAFEITTEAIKEKPGNSEDI